MGVKRVLVVDDSLTIRKLIVELINKQFDFTVVGEAQDGQEAIELTERLKPDVITMDMMMPKFNGYEATRLIMANCPTPILIISASTNRGELMKTYDVLAAGAVSVVEKPGASATIDDTWEHELLVELRLVSRIPVVRHLEGQWDKDLWARKTNGVGQPLATVASKAFTHVVIGGSTGAPGALNTLLKALPEDFALPIVCVIHINDAFSTSLAQWLDRSSKLNVVTPQNHETYNRPGCVFVAPCGVHLVMDKFRLRYSDGPLRNYCRPSVDELFESAAKAQGSGLIGVLLTGMGKDGAQGIKAIKEAGGYTITQSEESCVVYGMPAQADKLCDNDKHLSPQAIAEHLVALADKSYQFS
ncbi:MAG: two-component system chemotaxis response regulator CheB [Alteromonadaceae bacterium]|jgi:two-component system chemotaxis response regulator CheB